MVIVIINFHVVLSVRFMEYSATWPGIFALEQLTAFSSTLHTYPPLPKKFKEVESRLRGQEVLTAAKLLIDFSEMGWQVLCCAILCCAMLFCTELDISACCYYLRLQLRLLAPGGRCYMVLVAENKPSQIKQWALQHGCSAAEVF
jgi:hypothetical protein